LAEASISPLIPAARDNEIEPPIAREQTRTVDAGEQEAPPVPRFQSPPISDSPAPARADGQSGAATEGYPEDDEDDFETKQRRLPRFLGVLGLLVALAAAASCWIPEIDPWTLYIALGGVAVATLGFGVAMSRHRIGLMMPLVGLLASLLAMALPFALPLLGKAAPAHYVARAEQARQDRDQATIDAQSRGILYVQSVHLTGNKESLAPEVEYKLINKSGKVIRLIHGSIQLSDRDHRALGGLALDLPGPIEINATVQGKNNWTMEDATQAALADNKVDADYRTRQVLYADGTVQTFNQR
jgi:hypothetical protein